MNYQAWVRPVSASLAHCELSFVDRDTPDVSLAVRQHQTYVEALRQLGCIVHTLPALDAQPDAVFVEDTAIIVDELAVITRPGAESRRAESASTRQALAAHMPVVEMCAPATLDGGDVLRIGRTLFVGQSARTNADGHAQLATLVEPLGYDVVAMQTRDCLHLKSAATEVAEGVVLVQPAWLADEALQRLASRYRLVEVDPSEPHAANTVRLGGSVIHPDCFPHTTARLRDLDIQVLTVDVSELQKAEGAVTCCSLIRRSD
ncbi:MAG: dimethylargininase [Xanthomonadales bacterium]|nr:dimethylargininase [Xanthomonadales bacterium]